MRDQNVNRGGSGGGMDAITFGLMTHLKTGNVAVDMLMIALLPTMIAVAAQFSRQLRPMTLAVFRSLIKAFGCGQNMKYSRIVRLERRVQRYGSTAVDPDSRNAILHKAISLYLSESQSLAVEDTAKYRLMHLGKEKVSGPYYAKTYGATSDHLKQYKILTAVPDEIWVECLPFRVEIMRSSNQNEKEGGEDHQDQRSRHKDESAETIDYHVSACGKDGNVRIDQFLTTAFEFYKQKIRAQEDKGRHLYIRSNIYTTGRNNHQEADADDNNETAAPTYKRYKLNDRSFHTLWFPQKDKLLSVFDDFLMHKNKFGIKGYRRKLGILLHGPPGCGKTSLIKALATRSHRNIVSIDISKIKTNQELMDTMFDLKFKVENLDCPLQLKFSKVIFVLEDLDAAGSLVLSRAKKLKQKQEEASKIQDHGVDPIMKLLLMMSAAEDQTTPNSFMHQANNSTITTKQNNIDSYASGTFIGPSKHDDNDRLDLSGLLNILDGVVDTPERIVIITTNYPEHLDPALIRPGRIDIKLGLGYLELPEALSMIAHYVHNQNTLSATDTSRISAAWLASPTAKRGMTPAQLEQLSSSCFTTDDIVTALLEISEDDDHDDHPKLVDHSAAAYSY